MARNNARKIKKKATLYNKRPFLYSLFQRGNQGKRQSIVRDLVLLVGILLFSFAINSVQRLYVEHSFKKTVAQIKPKVEQAEQLTIVRHASDDQAYKKLMVQVTQMVNDEDPRKALELMEKQMNADKKLLNSCHPIVHQIGRTAFLKYKDVNTALQYGDETCGSGYFHGVIEARVANVKDIYTEIYSICPPDAGNCYHGLGHGLMYYTGNNIPEALKICDTFAITAEKTYCAEGVFMENYNSDIASHPSEYLDPKNTLYPCAEQSVFYKAPCYYYSNDYYLILHKGDYAGAIQACMKAEPGYVASCINGFGSRSTKKNISNPKNIEKYCNTLSDDLRPYCIDGIVSYYVVHHASTQKGNEMCATFDEKNRASCLTSVASRTHLFAD